jgi:hypothetical protein
MRKFKIGDEVVVNDYSWCTAINTGSGVPQFGHSLYGLVGGTPAKGVVVSCDTPESALRIKPDLLDEPKPAPKSAVDVAWEAWDKVMENNGLASDVPGDKEAFINVVLAIVEQAKAGAK